MEKIKQTFKNIYSGENAKNNHLIYFFILLSTALTSAAFQMVDKDYPDYMVPMFITGVILAILSIPMIICSLGVYIKYINNKFNTDYAFPQINGETFKAGLKAIPVIFAWTAYIIVALLAYIVIGVLILSKLFSDSSGVSSAVALCAFISLLIIFIVAVVVASPFINMIYVKFAKNLQYSGEIFNPMTVVKYIKTSFVPVFMIALKYVLVSIVANVAVMLFAAVLLMIATVVLIFAKQGSITNTTAGFVLMFMTTAITAWITGYVSSIVSLAMSDNLTEYYKNEIDSDTIQSEE